MSDAPRWDTKGKPMIRTPRWNRKRWWVVGVSVLITGAAGCGASEDSKRSASESHSQNSQRATPTPREEESQLSFRRETALTAARYHIDSGGVSKRALIQRMTAGGLSRADAKFAADNVGADWKEEAVEQARDRLDDLEYSKRSLIAHLGSDGFTRAQAEYAVSKVYD